MSYAILYIPEMPVNFNLWPDVYCMSTVVSDPFSWYIIAWLVISKLYHQKVKAKFILGKPPELVPRAGDKLMSSLLITFYATNKEIIFHATCVSLNMGVDLYMSW